MQKHTSVLLIFLCIVAILTAGCTSSKSTATSLPISTPLIKYTNVLVTPTKTVMAPDTTLTVSNPDATRDPTKTQTPKPTITFVGTPANTPDFASFFCSGDKCGTLIIQLTCNPRILFRRVAILKIKDPNNTTERSAAVASIGKNFVNVLPDGSVIPVNITPGRYTLVLLDAKNVQVPESGVISSMRSASVTTNKITTAVFKEECR